MTRTIGTFGAIVIAVALANAQEKPAAKPADTSDAMLIANERALYDAVAKADKAAFQSLALMPEGVWTSKGGFTPMELLVNALNGFKLSKWDLVNPRVTWLGRDSAIVLYVWTGEGTLNGQPLAGTTLAATAWTRRNGKWLAAHHQETDLVK